MKDTYFTGRCIGLLKKLIATPSFSREEDRTSEISGEFFLEKKYSC